MLSVHQLGAGGLNWFILKHVVLKTDLCLNFLLRLKNLYHSSSSVFGSTVALNEQVGRAVLFVGLIMIGFKVIGFLWSVSDCIF